MSAKEVFNKQLALKLARLSEKCYGCLTYQIGDNGFLLEEDEENIYIVFPGSDQFSDWVADIAFVKVERNMLGKIHGGFADLFDELRSPLMNLLKGKHQKNIILTGHSMGAAIGSVFALSLYNLGFKVKVLYTFGSPRVGDKKFEKNFEKSGIPHFRIKNGNDIVTENPDWGFYHVGKEIHINRRSWFSWFHTRPLDHKISNYIKSLENMSE